MSKRKQDESQEGANEVEELGEDEGIEELITELFPVDNDPADEVMEILTPIPLASASPSVIDISALSFVLISMGLEKHIMQTLAKTKEKAKYIINNFGSLLIFIREKCSLPFDMTDPVASTECMIELLVNRHFVQIPCYAADHLTATRSVFNHLHFLCCISLHSILPALHTQVPCTIKCQNLP